MKRSFRHVSAVAAHLGRSLLGRSDYRRWSGQDNLQQFWDQRTKALADLIEPGSGVLELGAGACRLRDFLPEACRYTPSDLVSRGPDTFICDLNERPLPELTAFDPDVVVLSGVLEYVTKPADIARWLAGQTPSVVLSYQCVADNTSLAGRLPLWIRRSRHGWVNHFDTDGLLALFDRAGFACVKRGQWRAHSLFLLRRDHGPSGDG